MHLKEYKPLNINPKNIVLKMPNWIGDAVMATPIVCDLKHYFPKAKLTALCQTNIASLIQTDPHLDEILAYQKPSGWIHRAEHRDVIDPLRWGEYDLGILLTNSFSSAWWFWRGNVQTRIGFAKFPRTSLLTNPVKLPKDIDHLHLVNVYKLLLGPLGIPISNTNPTLYLSSEDHEYAKTFFHLQHIKKDEIVVGINPGAAYGSAKCWMPDRFREIIQRIISFPNVKVLLFGDNATLSLADQICSGFNSQVLNLAGKTTLRELIALIANCQVFLTNDSGPMHIASALKIPLIALFGSTNATKTGPFNGGVVIDKQAECSPCYKRECPIDFRCMKNITVDEVYQALYQMIRKQNGKHT